MSGGARHRAPGPGVGRRLAAVVAALVFGTSVLATLVVGSSSADAATDRAVVPVGGEVPLLGHGFGHGRGLSQYGAYGARDDRGQRGADPRLLLRRNDERQRPPSCPSTSS